MSAAQPSNPRPNHVYGNDCVCANGDETDFEFGIGFESEYDCGIEYEYESGSENEGWTGKE